MPNPPNRPTFSSRLRSLRLGAVSVLTKVQHATGPVFGLFVIVHLSAPLVATIGGSQASSQVMLLGREYYQTQLEPLVVFGPLALHIGAALLKRILQARLPPLTLLTLTGWPAAFLIGPHVLAHRLAPQLMSSPSDVDYELPKYALHNFPLRTMLLYGALTTTALLHSGEGAMLMGKRYAGARPSRTGTRIVHGAIAVTVMAGVLVMYREPLWIFDGREPLYAQVLAEAPFYGLGA